MIAFRPQTISARRRPPLTLLPGRDPGMRESLPLPASGERVGVRGAARTTFDTVAL
jgi:hypothetical protein